MLFEDLFEVQLRPVETHRDTPQAKPEGTPHRKIATMQARVQCGAGQGSAVWRSVVQCGAVWCSVVQCDAVLPCLDVSSNHYQWPCLLL